MAKKQCYRCNKSLGMWDVSFSKEDAQTLGIHIPDEIPSKSMICSECYVMFQKESEHNMGRNSEGITHSKQTDPTDYKSLNSRVPQYKPNWDKNGVIQYKDEYVAILRRMIGSQVEFIIAYSDLTRDGYRCVAQDEGKSGNSGGFGGGVDSYYYFQNMKYVSDYSEKQKETQKEPESKSSTSPI